MKLIIPEFFKGPEEDKSKDVETMAANLLCEINFIGGQLLQIWFKWMELLKIVPKFVLAVLQHDYNKKIRDRWGLAFERSIIRTNDYATNPVVNVPDKNKQLASKKRKGISFQGMDPIHVIIDEKKQMDYIYNI